ncbi:Sec20-domain-containing protein [Polyporus arcularius HHB13444]|uniref:Sec20-domain-containing protein n=1 Tax=Polyporus arcularius HHB13444 TaxID=1314778 RepID=A0A5C3PSD2_9APHY|nr:Sec20-domain-containing protein [Polyporus arcularius HHB13444]
MPPLPSAVDQETANIIASLERRQKDLTDFQIPRLRSCTGPLALQQQYAAEVRDDLDVFARQLESLDVAVEDQRTERARRELRQVVDDFQATLTRLRKDMRAAVLASKRAIDAQQTSRREELLRSSVVREKQTLNEKATEDAVMKTTNDVTEALQRTLGLMQGELERSVLSTQLLESSTANLKSTSTTHDVLDSLMTTSKHLITALEKSDWLDRMLIFAGLAFFVLVVLFILKQRLVDRGLRIALWWTRFVPDFSGDDALLAMEKGQESLSASSIASTVAATVATAAVSVASSVVVTCGTDTPACSDPVPTSTILEALSSVVTDFSRDSSTISAGNNAAAETTESSHDQEESSTSSAGDAAEETTGAHDEL